MEETMILRVMMFCFLFFNLIGCDAMPCDKSLVDKLFISESGLDFNIYDEQGKFWGEFAIYNSDKTISHYNNSGTNFRDDVKDLEYVRYTGNEESGLLEVKWPEDRQAVCVAAIPYSYWQEIKNIVTNWELGSKIQEVQRK
jgi:hypothetical protein